MEKVDQVSLKETFESAEKTHSTIKNLLEDPEVFEENRESILNLTKKYQEKIKSALKILDPVAKEEDAPDTIKLTQNSLEFELKRTRFEFFPNPNAIKISRSLKPLVVPEQLESGVKSSESQFQGPYLVTQETESGVLKSSFFCQFQDGKPKGCGRMIYDNGNMIEGEFEGVFLNGYGRVVNWNGSYVEGYFKDGVPHGKCKFTNSPEFSGEDMNSKFFYDGKKISRKIFCLKN